MGVLSDFFLAPRGSVPSYPGEGDWPSDDRCELKGLTPLECAGILAALREEDDALALTDAFELVASEDESWTMSTPADLVEQLANLGDDQLAETAARCAELTAEELGWPQTAFESVLEDLRELARRAKESDRALFLWNSL